MATRSNGVTVLSVLIIIGSLLGMGGLASPDQLSPPMSLMFYLVILPASLVVAIFLMKLKPWARQAIVVISIVIAIESLITLPFVLGKSEEVYSETIRENITVSLAEAEERQDFQDVPTTQAAGEIQNLQIPEEQVEKLAMNMFKSILALMILLSIGFNMLVIYFFTRPEVVGQFS
jgi:hypothetical protein